MKKILFALILLALTCSTFAQQPGETAPGTCPDCIESGLDVGDDCDDNNAATSQDVIQEDCSCEGDFQCPIVIVQSPFCTETQSCITLDITGGSGVYEVTAAPEIEIEYTYENMTVCVGVENSGNIRFQISDAVCGGLFQQLDFNDCIVLDCPEIMANIGDPCDDGDETTEADTIQEDCTCVGSTSFDCPETMANIGDPCDDGDEATEADTIQEDCTCVGSTTFDCPEIMANIGDECTNELGAIGSIDEDCACLCEGCPYYTYNCETKGQFQAVFPFSPDDVQCLTNNEGGNNEYSINWLSAGDNNWIELDGWVRCNGGTYASLIIQLLSNQGIDASDVVITVVDDLFYTVTYTACYGGQLCFQQTCYEVGDGFQAPSTCDANGGTLYQLNNGAIHEPDPSDVIGSTEIENDVVVVTNDFEICFESFATEGFTIGTACQLADGSYIDANSGEVVPNSSVSDDCQLVQSPTVALDEGCEVDFVENNGFICCDGEICTDSNACNFNTCEPCQTPTICQFCDTEGISDCTIAFVTDIGTQIQNQGIPCEVTEINTKSPCELPEGTWTLEGQNNYSGTYPFFPNSGAYAIGGYNLCHNIENCQKTCTRVAIIECL